MGSMNFHQIKLREFEDSSSTVSSNIDYAEIFEEKFKIVYADIMAINQRFNHMRDLIEQNTLDFRRMNNDNAKMTEQYVNTLHQEFDQLSENTSKCL